MGKIIDQLTEVRGRIDAACEEAGRPTGSVDLIAVSKRKPVEAVVEAFAGGQSEFGESRVQELLEKAAEVPEGVKWHFIGHLQKNKIRRVLPHVDLFHGVDSLELAESMNRIAEEEGLSPRVLLEVNVSGEESKQGFSPQALRRDIGGILELDRVNVMGLMTLAPYDEDPESARPVFRALRKLRDEIAEETKLPLETLSMGMSGDFAVAISEGATMVRVGTSIFGERPDPK